MVKFISILALSVITPIFASVLWDLETRDVSEPHLFGRELSDAEAAVYARDIQVLFARHDSPKEKLKKSNERFKRFMNNLLHPRRRELDEEANKRVPVEEIPHAPPTKHELSPPPDKTRREFNDLVDRDFDDELLERDLDHELYIRDLTEEDLFQRFYDDLD